MTAASVAALGAGHDMVLAYLQEQVEAAQQRLAEADVEKHGSARRETYAMPMLARGDIARVEPKTIDEEQRTVEVTWTTGARVRRHGFFTDDFDEELSLDEGAVDLGRLNSGAPVLNSHNAFDLTSVVGVVERAWIQGPKGRREGRAVLRFSDRADVEPIWRDMRAGILRNISVGYEVSKWERVERKGDVALMRASSWTPLELSLVPIPADPRAQVRSKAESTLYPCIIESKDLTMAELASRPADEAGRHLRTAPGGDQMGGGPVPPEQNKTESPPEEKPEEENVPTSPPAIPDDAAVPAESTGPVPNIDAGGEKAGDKKRSQPSAPNGPSRAEMERAAELAAQRAVAAERARASGIMAAADKLKIDRSHAQKLIEQGIPLDEARGQLIDLKAAQQEETMVRTLNPIGHGTGVAQFPAGSVQVLNDEGRNVRDAMTAAILHRYSPGRFQLSDHARQYRGLDLSDIAREVLELNGVKTRAMGKTAIAEMALKPGHARLGGLHTTSDFASILSNVTNTSLRAGYDAAPRTFTGWARRATIADYRPVTRTQLSNMPALLRVREHGEYERGTLTEGKESYSLGKFGRVVGITSETIINDSLDAFTRIPEGFGVSAANLESDIVYSVLLANATMSDGVALFHANHGNLGSAAALGATPIGAAYASMMKQTGLDGVTVLSITPQYLLAPPSLITVAQQLLTTITPAQTANVVPEFIRTLTPVIEPRLETGVTVDGTAYTGSATAYYMLASPAVVDTVEYAYLEGEEGVYTETRNGFDVDGVEVKARLNFAAKALDWRGMSKNAGA